MPPRQIEMKTVLSHCDLGSITIFPGFAAAVVDELLNGITQAQALPTQLLQGVDVFGFGGKQNAFEWIDNQSANTGAHLGNEENLGIGTGQGMHGFEQFIAAIL